MAKVKVWRDEGQREYDRATRPEKLIREDLKQQLEEIYRKQMEKFRASRE